MKTSLETSHLNSLPATKPKPPIALRIAGLIALLTLLGGLRSSHASGSFTWLLSPTDGNWETSGSTPTTEVNWSSGTTNWPGSTGTSSPDTATFNTNSSRTLVTINASDWCVKYVVFDSAHCSAYTISNTESGEEARWNGPSAVTNTSTQTQPQVIKGSEMRLHSGGGLSLVNNSATATATLTFAASIKANNSMSANLFDQAVNLEGSNAGNNVFSGVIADYQAPPTVGQIAAVTKSGTGTWFLTGNNTYTGPTVITGGTLILSGAGAINHSTNVVVSGATLQFTNAMNLAAVTTNNNTATSCLFLTNSAVLIITNTVSQTPATVNELVLSNCTIHVGVNGGTPFNNMVVSSALTAGPGVAFSIDQAVAVVGASTFTLISYAGADPDPTDFSVTLAPAYVAAGYTVSGASVGGGAVTATITPPASTSLVWVGATNSVLVGSWDTNKTADWVDQATLSIPQVYMNPDSVAFNDNASNGLVTVITTNTPNAMDINNSQLNYVFNGPGKISGFTALTKEGSATLTLADNGDDFSGSITVSGGTLILDNTNGNISAGLTLYGNTTVQIGNNDAYGALPAGTLDDEGTLVFQRANNYTLSTVIPGGGEVIQNGSGKLTMTTTNLYSGVTIASMGTLALTGGGAISNSPGLLVSNATFDVSGIAGVTLLNDFSITNASLTLSATNVFPPLVVSTFEVDGILAVSNIINLTTLPGVAQYPVTIPLIMSANPITLTAGNFNIALGSLPGGATGYLSESSDDTTILLTLTSGPTGQRSSVTWIGVDNTSATTNWSDGLNWELPGAPGAADNVFFSGGSTTVSGETTVNNFVDNNFTIGTLTYKQTASGQWHVTQIPLGNTLAVSGATLVGGATADGAKTEVAMVDAGTLVLNNSLTIGDEGVTGPDSGTILDLSGLSNFVFNASSGSLTLGSGNRSAGNLNLAAVSNNITAGTINANTASASSTTSGTLTLGSGTNILNVGTFNVAAERTTCTIEFPAGVTTAGLRLRGAAGTDTNRCTMTVGDRTASGSSGTTTGTLSLDGNQVDMKFATLTVGECTAATPNIGSGVLEFDTGTIDASNLLMAVNTGTGTANSTVTVGASATLVVGMGGISLVNQTSTGSATGSFTDDGGTVICSNSILKTTSAGSTANLTLTGGTLNMLAGVIGTLALPIDNLTLNGGSTIQLNVVLGVTNISAANLSASGTTILNLASVSTSFGGPQQIPLINYTGGDPTTNGLIVGTVPAGYSNASLVDDAAGHIYLAITAPPELIWVGAVGSVLNSSWDTHTLDWSVGGSPTAYADMDFVQFDDTASNSVVTIAGTVSPGGLDVINNVLNYTFNGGGQISGAVALLKQGSATLVLDNGGINNFSGGVNILGGALQVGNNDANGNLPGSITDNGSLILDRIDNLTLANVISGSGTVNQVGADTITLSGANTNFTGQVLVTNGILNTTATTGLGAAPATVVVSTGGSFDDNGIAFNGAAAPRLTVSGPGFNGAGAIVNNGPQQTSAFSNLTVAANVTFGGTNRWDLRAATGTAAFLNMSPAGSPYSITKVGTNQISLVNVGTIDAGLGNIYVQQGEFAVQEGTAQLGNPGSNIVVSAGATLETFSLSTPLNKVITLNGNGTIDSFRADSGGATLNFVTGPVTLNGNCLFEIASNVFATFGVISGPGSLTKNSQGTLSLTNANTYTGNTTVNGGTLAIQQPTLATNSTVSVASGAVLQLGFAVANQVAALVLNGVSQAAGVYNSTTGAPFITGSGSLLVVPTGPGIFTNPTGITGFSLNGSNVMITGTNGQAGDAYYLLESTNVALPKSQWTPVWTNVPGSAGNYSFTATNVIFPGAMQQFYILSNTND